MPGLMRLEERTNTFLKSNNNTGLENEQCLPIRENINAANEQSSPTSCWRKRFFIFSSSGCQSNSAMREIFEVSVKPKDHTQFFHSGECFFAKYDKNYCWHFIRSG